MSRDTRHLSVEALPVRGPPPTMDAIGGDEMDQVAPEDRLQVVNRQQAEWRSQAAGERMDRTQAGTAPSRRPAAIAVAASVAHRLAVHATHLLHALAAGPRHGWPRPTH